MTFGCTATNPPPLEPDDGDKVNTEEFPADAPFKEMDLSHPVPEKSEPGIAGHATEAGMAAFLSSLLAASPEPDCSITFIFRSTSTESLES